MTLYPDFIIAPESVARVKNVLPVPTECPYCQGDVRLIPNKLLYGKPTGKWPWAYRCENCRACVGLHPFTDIPLGSLANQRLRNLRSAAKSSFNPLWKEYGLSRNKAYAFLAREMNIALDHTHIGWFNEEQCTQAIVICRTEIARRGPPTTKAKHDTKNDSPRVPDWFDERNQYL